MFIWFHNRKNVRDGETRAGRNRNRPAPEILERRELLAGTQPYLLSGDRWSNATPITYSIADDGVTWDRKANDLNAAMDAKFGAGAWQDEIARALQTWASVANIDFVRVADSPLAFDASGKAQGDARFGDIRFGGYDFGNTSQLAHAYNPPPNGSTAAGDVALNTAMAFAIGGDYDLFSVVLHETGHSLGLEHPDNPDAVMNQTYGGVRAGLLEDDIAGIRAIYGVRPDDGYGQQGRGTGFSDAVAVAAPPSFPAQASVEDLTLTTVGDADYFSFVPQTGGTLQVTAAVGGVSLLSPQVSLYDASKALLDTEGSPAQYGQDVSASTAVVTPGQLVYIKVSGSTDDVFSIGSYDLNLSVEGGQGVGTTVQVPIPTRIPTPLAGNSPVTPQLSPVTPPPAAWKTHPAWPTRQLPWRRQMFRFELARLRRSLADADGQARASLQSRQEMGDRVTQEIRFLSASKIVAQALRPDRFGRTSASSLIR